MHSPLRRSPYAALGRSDPRCDPPGRWAGRPRLARAGVGQAAWRRGAGVVHCFAGCPSPRAWWGCRASGRRRAARRRAARSARRDRARPPPPGATRPRPAPRSARGASAAPRSPRAAAPPRPPGRARARSAPSGRRSRARWRRAGCCCRPDAAAPCPPGWSAAPGGSGRSGRPTWRPPKRRPRVPQAAPPRRRPPRFQRPTVAFLPLPPPPLLLLPRYALQMSGPQR